MHLLSGRRLMAQKIKIKISGREYNLTAQSEDQEELFRLAADAINRRLEAYTVSHPGKTAYELMSLVALNETIFRLGLQKEMQKNKDAEQQLQGDLERYLKEIK